MAKTSALDFLKVRAKEDEHAATEKPDWVKIGIKLSVDDHARLVHNLALKRSNIQQYGMEAISRAMEADGLAPFSPYNGKSL